MESAAATPLTKFLREAGGSPLLTYRESMKERDVTPSVLPLNNEQYKDIGCFNFRHQNQIAALAEQKKTEAATLATNGLSTDCPPLRTLVPPNHPIRASKEPITILASATNNPFCHLNPEVASGDSLVARQQIQARHGGHVQYYPSPHRQHYPRNTSIAAPADIRPSPLSRANPSKFAATTGLSVNTSAKRSFSDGSEAPKRLLSPQEQQQLYKKAKGFDKLDLLCSTTLEIGELHDNPDGCSCPKSKVSLSM